MDCTCVIIIYFFLYIPIKVLLLDAMKKGNVSKMKAILEDSDPELDINSTGHVSTQMLAPSDTQTFWQHAYYL